VPRYFFDIDDEDRHTYDESGEELPDLEAARSEAIRVLPDIARDVLPDSDRHVFVCRVRDETGKVVFRVTLSLVAEWLI
jgi:hypothetical protein